MRRTTLFFPPPYVIVWRLRGNIIRTVFGWGAETSDAIRVDISHAGKCPWHDRPYLFRWTSVAGRGGVGVATGQIVGFSRCLALPTFSRYGACVYVCVRVRAFDSVCNDRLPVLTLSLSVTGLWQFHGVFTDLLKFNATFSTIRLYRAFRSCSLVYL